MANKRLRVQLSLSKENELQSAAYEYIHSQDKGQRTDYICRAVCDYERQRELLESIRQILREELQNNGANSAPTYISKIEREDTAGSVSNDVLGFLRSLEEGDDY